MGDGKERRLERKIEFIIDQQATFAVDIAELKEVQRQQAASIAGLTENMHATGAMLNETRQMIGQMIVEMREGFENLIIANEVTRKLSEDVGRLAIATSQRVTLLESKLEGTS
jgi:hypothetical protein